MYSSKPSFTSLAGAKRCAGSTLRVHTRTRTLALTLPCAWVLDTGLVIVIRFANILVKLFSRKKLLIPTAECVNIPTVQSGAVIAVGMPTFRSSRATCPSFDNGRESMNSSTAHTFPGKGKGKQQGGAALTVPTRPSSALVVEQQPSRLGRTHVEGVTADDGWAPLPSHPCLVVRLLCCFRSEPTSLSSL